MKHERFWIAVITLLFVILGVVYSLATPIFEASDELWHYPVVKHIADGRGLPVQQSGVEALWQQEGSQPPAYYALAALVTAWIDTDDLSEVRWLNPMANTGRPLAAGNKNLIIHTEREAFPWRGSALAVHLIRFLSVLLGASVVYLTYRWPWRFRRSAATWRWPPPRWWRSTPCFSLSPGRSTTTTSSCPWRHSSSGWWCGRSGKVG